MTEKGDEEAEAALAAYHPRHKKEKQTWCCTFYPNQKYPKTTDVPLNEEEEKIWMEFKEFDKDNPRRKSLSFKHMDKEIRLIDVHHPIASLVANFAVAAFNDAIEMYVKKDEHNNLHDFELMKCSYLKVCHYYYFDITIEAVEERKLCVYEAKVRLKWEDGSKSLGKFVHKNRKPLGYKCAHVATSGSWLCPRMIPNTGLRCRVRGTTCRGYDYHTPWSVFGYL